MMNDIESYNYDDARKKYKELLRLRDVLRVSPYEIEFKIYELIYNLFVEGKKYDEIEEDIKILNKIYESFDDNLKYMYLFLLGSALIKKRDNDRGIKILEKALKIKQTSWVNYIIGKALCFNNNPGSGSYYLEKALENYESSGRYLNAI